MKNVFKLSREDLLKLYMWRDRHADEIRKNRDFAFIEGTIDVGRINTFSRIEFKQIEGGFNFKYKVSNRKTFLPMVSFDYKLMEGSLGVVNVKFKIPALTEAEKEILVNDIISIYFSLNYYSLKNKIIKVTKEHKNNNSYKGVPKTNSDSKSISLENVKYISTSDNKRERGNITYHTKEWNVKGYYRHYKSGKVVFIKPSQRKRASDKINQTTPKTESKIYTL